MWIRSVCLLFCLSTVVRYYMKYTGLSIGTNLSYHHEEREISARRVVCLVARSPPISFLDVLLIVRGARQ